MERFLFIINPAAGRQKGREAYQFISNYISNIKEVSTKIVLTEYPEHAKEIALNLCRDFDYLIAVGGDGTLNEMINGIDLNSEKIIGFLPIGTGNDFSRNIYKNYSLNETLKNILSKNFSIKKIDLGLATIIESNNKITEHRFINNLGIGFDAEAAYNKGKIKLFTGIYSYIFSVLHTLIKFKSISVCGNFDSIKFSGDKLLVSIGNGITSGGGFYLTPDALIDDGFLDVCFIDSLSRIQILKKIPFVLSNKIKSLSEAKLYKFKELFSEFSEKVKIHADGEIISVDAVNVKIKVLPGIINMIYEN